jgi:hypothetical protein
MAEITGEDIPEEEMKDTNQKLLAAAGAGRTQKKEPPVKDPVLQTSPEDTAAALNSVASLFSSVSSVI